ncbi:MAG: hypothetical protein J5929_09600 [Eubacterium sp.]|nr:hypothetical protein [Eubacterium sp.]
MKCRICGRKITDPNSLRVGIGPICYKLIYGEQDNDKPEEEVIYKPIPGQMNILDYEENTDGKINEIRQDKRLL